MKRFYLTLRLQCAVFLFSFLIRIWVAMSPVPQVGITSVENSWQDWEVFVNRYTLYIRTSCCDQMRSK